MEPIIRRVVLRSAKHHPLQQHEELVKLSAPPSGLPDEHGRHLTKESAVDVMSQKKNGVDNSELVSAGQQADEAHNG